MAVLTGGDLNRPVVAVGWNGERFDGRNLALRLVALGYTQVYWSRRTGSLGGRGQPRDRSGRGRLVAPPLLQHGALVITRTNQPSETVTRICYRRVAVAGPLSTFFSPVYRGPAWCA